MFDFLDILLFGLECSISSRIVFLEPFADFFKIEENGTSLLMTGHSLCDPPVERSPADLEHVHHFLSCQPLFAQFPFGLDNTLRCFLWTFKRFGICPELNFMRNPFHG